MEKYFPYEKLSEKGNDTTAIRKPENSKVYNRRKSQNGKRELARAALRLFS